MEAVSPWCCSNEGIRKGKVFPKSTVTEQEHYDTSCIPVQTTNGTIQISARQSKNTELYSCSLFWLWEVLKSISYHTFSITLLSSEILHSSMLRARQWYQCLNQMAQFTLLAKMSIFSGDMASFRYTGISQHFSTCHTFRYHRASTRMRVVSQSLPGAGCLSMTFEDWSCGGIVRT